MLIYISMYKYVYGHFRNWKFYPNLRQNSLNIFFMKLKSATQRAAFKIKHSNIIQSKDRLIWCSRWRMVIGKYEKSLFSVIKPSCFCKSSKLCIYYKNTAVHYRIVSKPSWCFSRQHSLVLRGAVAHAMHILMLCVQNHGCSTVVWQWPM